MFVLHRADVPPRAPLPRPRHKGLARAHGCLLMFGLAVAVITGAGCSFDVALSITRSPAVRIDVPAAQAVAVVEMAIATFDPLPPAPGPDVAPDGECPDCKGTGCVGDGRIFVDCGTCGRKCSRASAKAADGRASDCSERESRDGEKTKAEAGGEVGDDPSNEWQDRPATSAVGGYLESLVVKAVDRSADRAEAKMNQMLLEFGEAAKRSARPAAWGADGGDGGDGEAGVAAQNARVAELEAENESLKAENLQLKTEVESLKAKLADADRLVERYKPRPVPAVQPAVPKPGEKPVVRPGGVWKIGENGGPPTPPAPSEPERFAENYPPGTPVEKGLDGVWRRVGGLAVPLPAPQPSPSTYGPAYSFPSPFAPSPPACPNGKCRLRQ